MKQNSRDVFTHFGKTLLGLSLTGGGLGLLRAGILILVGGLLLKSITSGFSSVKQIPPVTPLLIFKKNVLKQLTFIPFVFSRAPLSIAEASVFTKTVASNTTKLHLVCKQISWQL